ncbi:MAG: chemotaxis protein CheB [Deltaproteobacteria bacterium]|nr:chemotaxis protein CheB [Deltaproteobacteria bacterium]
MRSALVVVGASLGGVSALRKVLGALPAGFGVPVVVVQHRLAEGGDELRRALQEACTLPVCEAEDKQELRPGAVYLAPADYHLLVELGHLSLSTEEPVHYSRPAVDPLFESAAEAYGKGVVGVVLTGSNSDGAAGAARIAAAGGKVVVQDAAEAERPEMPWAAGMAVGEPIVLRLGEIAGYLRRLAAEEER